MKTSVFITNGTTALGKSIATYLTMNHQIQVSSNVWNVDKCGNLPTNGVRVMDQVNMSGVETLIVVPDLSSKNFVQESKDIMNEACLKKVKNCIFLSQVGIDNVDIPVAQKFIELEEHLNQSDFKSKSIVRATLWQEFVMWMKGSIQSGKLPLPLTWDCIFAPIALEDLSLFVALLVQSPETFVYEISGPEQVNPLQVSKQLSLLTKKNIEFQTVSREQMKVYLQDRMNNETFEVLMDLFELVSLGHQKEVTKMEPFEPKSMKQFLQEMRGVFID